MNYLVCVLITGHMDECFVYGQTEGEKMSFKLDSCFLLHSRVAAMAAEVPAVKGNGDV